ncbi:MAG TPA: polysaccharide pyruvyl transferase family protein [Acidimicrobiia bacterium]|nr:polysaccharide pyruvyl transferase family protein [Acidimicrobiia bacterium]
MAAVRVAIWGTFDVDNYGDHLFPRVAAHELARRLPGAVVDAFSPYGWLHPTALDDGRAAAPLGPWSPERARQLAAAHHLVVVGGGELIHLHDPMLAAVYGTSTDELRRMAPSRFFVEGFGPELEADCPVVWHSVGVPWAPAGAQAERVRGALAGRPYVTVRDRHSAQRLAQVGVDGPVEVVPDSALLLDRIMPPEHLRARLARLRAGGGYPRAGSPVLVVQGCELLLPHVESVAAAVAHWQAARPERPEVVVVETGRCRGDGLFAAAFERALGRVWRLPAGAMVEDLAAAIAGGDAFLGSSLHGAITALAYGRPFVLLNLIDDAKLDGFGDLTGLDRGVVHAAAEIPGALDGAMAGLAPPGLLGALQNRIDRHFDRLAELALERAAARPDVVPDLSLDAYAVADHLGRLRGELGEVRTGLVRAEAELGAARARLDRAEAELQATGRRAGEAERELTALQATRTFRLLGPARQLYGRVRRMLT